ncbi:MAG: HlyD family efflux transporter periplasmic adaptor subunit [Clostridia bacterium]|nr:HlyD family efflux transporter periplasmic adaptor subunit [Clostridia bacterium]
MKSLRLLTLVLAALLALNGFAFAQTNIDFDGTVVGYDETLVTAPIGGKALLVPPRAGDRISAGDEIIKLMTEKVYASEDGVITGMFAAVGDSVTAVETRYGAVMYIEPTSKYTIDATTDRAYDSASTKYIHVGEVVYLACTSDAEHTGVGLVTAVSGTSYTVEVTSGSFYMGETVNIYRASNYRASSRLGRGDVARISNVSVTGTGSIVNLYVNNGDEVKRGDLLFETLTGEYDAYYCTGDTIYSPVSGIISEVNVAQGDDVTKDQIVAKIIPDYSMQIEFTVNEADLSDVMEGDEVSISFNWSEDLDEVITYTGTISSISHVSVESEDSTDASYTAYVDFTPGDEVRLGMTVLVSMQRAVEADDAEDMEEDEEDASDFELPAIEGEEGAEPDFGEMPDFAGAPEFDAAQ